MAENVRVALIGYGLAGMVFHAPLVASIPNTVIGGIVVRDPAKRELARQKFPSAQLLDSVDDVVANSDKYDLAIVASPNKTHYEFAKRLLQAGLHVVVDKPMAPTYIECIELTELAESKGLLLSVFQNRRWDADFLTLKRLIDEDRLGTIYRFESRFERWRPSLRANHWRESGGPEEFGGMLYDLGSHLVDQVLTLFGEPTDVYAELGYRREGTKVDDDAFVALTLPGGIQAHAWANAIACSGGPRFHVYGSKGTYTKFGLDPQENQLRAGMMPTESGFGIEPKESWGLLTYGTSDGGVEKELIKTNAGRYIDFYAGVIRAIREGAPNPVPPRSAAATIRVLEEARKSANSRASGGAVPLGKS